MKTLLLIVACTAITYMQAWSQVTILVDDATDFIDGYSVVTKGEYWVFMDTNGVLIDSNKIPKEYGRTLAWSEGVELYKDNGKYGYRTVHGKILVPAKFDYGFPITKGYGLLVNKIQIQDKNTTSINVSRYGGPDNKIEISLFNKQGDMLWRKTFNYTDVENFTEGIIQVKGSGKNGLINTRGVMVDSTSYLQINKFSDGLAAILVANEYGELKWGYIDTLGKIKITPFLTKQPSNFINGYAIIQDKEGKYGYLKADGSIAIYAKYLWAFPFENNHAVVMQDFSTYAAINESGKTIATIINAKSRYDNINDVRAYPLVLNETGNNLQFFANSKGMPLYKMYYKTANPYNSGLSFVTVEINGEIKKGFVNSKGEWKIVFAKESKY